MSLLKLTVIAGFVVFALAACFDSKPKRFVVAGNKSYETSLFRQHCAICHGPEGEGKTLDDGKIVPSLREGEFKFRSEESIYRQIADGGNGMAPFRGSLTERELRLMAGFVHHDLRGQ
jgi:mono/diheme cytochrome c family protein